MTNEELDAAVAQTLVAVPMAALDGLMGAASKYLDILARQGVESEQLLEAMRAHTTASKAISAAYQRATLEIERGMLKARGVALH